MSGCHVVGAGYFALDGLDRSLTSMEEAAEGDMAREDPSIWSRMCLPVAG